MTLIDETFDSTDEGDGVVAPCGCDAQDLNVRVSLHGLKHLLQRGDGNVLVSHTHTQIHT